VSGTVIFFMKYVFVSIFTKINADIDPSIRKVCRSYQNIINLRLIFDEAHIYELKQTFGILKVCELKISFL